MLEGFGVSVTMIPKIWTPGYKNVTLFLVVYCLFKGGGGAMRGSSRDRHHDDAYAESTPQLKRTILC